LHQDALLVAVKRGNISIIEALLDFNASPGATDILNRDAMAICRKFLKSSEEKREILAMLETKSQGQFKGDTFKYRNTVYMESLKPEDLLAKYLK